MIVCPYCQSQNADGSPYCAGCGQPMGTALAGPPIYARAPSGQRQGMAIASLVLGLLGLPLVFCFGIGFLAAVVGGVLGIIALSKASKEPHLYGGKGLAIGGLVASGLSLLLSILVVAAIAIPSLSRARVSANESAAIGDVRSVIAAQSTYAGANGGFYDTLECLGTPSNCIPRYPSNLPTMLDPLLVQAGVKGGYRRTLHLGAAVDPADMTDALSPSSVVAYAYVAVPVSQGQTGVRSFCGDDRGVVCYNADGREPDVVDGRCEPCRKLD
jgi:type II secretory pathway pseudopilin PulG